jgi:hypothetical protein
LIGSRRLRLICLAALVAPVLALRALIPAGFMAASVDGAWQIVLCRPEVMAGGHHHHHGQRSGVAVGDPTCPYAQSAGPALMPTLPELPASASMHGAAQPQAMTQTRLTFGPPRQQTPRGPPLLA